MYADALSYVCIHRDWRRKWVGGQILSRQYLIALGALKTVTVGSAGYRRAGKRDIRQRGGGIEFGNRNSPLGTDVPRTGNKWSQRSRSAERILLRDGGELAATGRFLSDANEGLSGQRRPSGEGEVRMKRASSITTRAHRGERRSDGAKSVEWKCCERRL